MKTVKTYDINELKELFPDGYDKAYQNYQNDTVGEQSPWQDEIMDSMKKCFSVAGVTLKNWSISTGERSWVKFTIPTYWSELADCDMLVDEYTGRKALNWLKESFGLKSVKSVNYIGHDKKKHTRYDTTKLDGEDWSCEFTGYCADHDFLDSLIKDVMKDNCTLEEAFNNLADVAAKLFENEYEYMMSEEYFLEQADCNDYQYLENGQQI